MSNRTDDQSVDPLDPRVIEFAYRRGFFPMPDPETNEILWFDPNPRAVIPFDSFHVSRSLIRSRRKRGYQITFDQAFNEVVSACSNRTETWITSEFKDMYSKMFQLGRAHSVEVWHQGRLVGGLFGLTFGVVFNGESMFSTMTDASKIAMWAMVERLQSRGFRLFEVQFMTEHLARMGAVGVPREQYHQMLDSFKDMEVHF